MNVSEVLANTLSGDATIRNAAEQQLSTAASQHFPEYLQMLSAELANEETQPFIRSAAGIALKNALTARERTRLLEVQQKWISQVDPTIKAQVKENSLRTLASNDNRAGTSAAQLIAAIAAIELPQNQWHELMPALVRNVGEGSDSLKQSSLTTIGYICESEDPDLRESLNQHSNAILTAVVQGARKEESNNDVRFAAMVALGDSLEFVRTNFDNDGERNYIMQVICEATQSGDFRIQQAAFGCLNRIMSLYYDKMKFYMEKALFGLTIVGMKHDEEEVAKLAIEFWCTVCEEESAIEDDNAQYQAEEGTELRPFFNFARIATPEVVPVLLELLTKQDEDAGDDEYNISRAAYQCLQLYSACVGGLVIQHVLAFVEQNLRHENWRLRDAAVSAFGAIMEGPGIKLLDPLVKQALPILVGMMNDKVLMVKDSAAYALGRICDCCGTAIDPELHLPSLIQALFSGLKDSPKMASSCCWALMNLAERFGIDSEGEENPLSKYFKDSVSALLTATERSDADNQLRTACYEVLNSFITNVGQDELPSIAQLCTVIIERLEKTIQLQNQIVSPDDRITLEEMQTSLTVVMGSIVQRLEKEIVPQADRIMQILLQILSMLPPNSSVPDAIFGTVGAMANALEEDFTKYMEAFAPFLFNALSNQEEQQLCSVAIGLVSDISRSIGDKVAPYCDNFMNHLLNNLQSNTLSQQFKPAILQCFGDVAQAIGGHFETYLQVVMGVLQQAASISPTSDSNYEMVEYVISLREGIMDAYDGIIIALKSGDKTQLLAPYVQHIFGFLSAINADPNKTENLMRSAMGVLGDLADAFPNGEFAQYFRADWINAMIKETRLNREYSPRTTETARWTREQVKRQQNQPS
ncbi:ARM repeat-containing protein [Choiromyces venosus 120613-1]|uniref:Importin-95 n=1 Tax=Choiromyces venosus 120613-1 TaxID=1336337 RepID=A0A3N4K9X0_9PEZI|nr:ARM repeat-containing protein [Choiromyces venosus 120613-1]